MNKNKLEFWLGIALIGMAIFMVGLGIWMETKIATSPRQLIPVNIEQSMIKVK